MRSPDAPSSKLAGSVSDIDFLEKTMASMNAQIASVSNVSNAPPNISESLKPDCKFNVNPTMEKLPTTALGEKKEKRMLTLPHEKQKL